MVIPAKNPVNSYSLSYGKAQAGKILDELNLLGLPSDISMAQRAISLLIVTNPEAL